MIDGTFLLKSSKLQEIYGMHAHIRWEGRLMNGLAASTWYTGHTKRQVLANMEILYQTEAVLTEQDAVTIQPYRTCTVLLEAERLI